MKLFRDLNISRKNQLKKYIFVYIVAILFCLLSVFLFFGNLNNIWRSLQKEDELEVAERAEYKKVVKVAGEQKAKKDSPEMEQEADIVIWGEGDDYEVTALQLRNMKEKFQKKEALSDCKEARILFVCRPHFEEAEIELLRQYSESGMTLFFTNIPDAEMLEDSGIKNLLGIARYKGVERKTGIRLAEKVLFGNITENKQKFSLRSVTLQPHTEVYGAALEKGDVKPENLSPVYWRYKKDGESGNVYVADEHVMNEASGYGAVSFLFEDLYGIYMYPVINAYCYAISGMPYTDEYSTSFLDKEYERDSIGVQNDIFFPEFKRCEERYDVSSTWYSTDEEELKKTENELLKYYLEGIEEEKDEIGTLGVNAKVKSPFKNRLSEWTPSFQWINEEADSIYVPYNVIKDEKPENVIFGDLGMCKGAGFNIVFTDVEPFLNKPEKKGEDDWVDFCRSMETVLGVEKEKMPWLERVTVGEAIYRIKSFTMMEPEITYSDHSIEADIGNFTGRAYFYLSLPKEVKEVKNARLTELYEDFYMVEATKEHVSIVYEEKKR